MCVIVGAIIQSPFMHHKMSEAPNQARWITNRTQITWESKSIPTSNYVSWIADKIPDTDKTWFYI